MFEDDGPVFSFLTRYADAYEKAINGDSVLDAFMVRAFTIMLGIGILVLLFALFIGAVNLLVYLIFTFPIVLLFFAIFILTYGGLVTFRLFNEM